MSISYRPTWADRGGYRTKTRWLDLIRSEEHIKKERVTFVTLSLYNNSVCYYFTSFESLKEHAVLSPICVVM